MLVYLALMSLLVVAPVWICRYAATVFSTSQYQPFVIRTWYFLPELQLPVELAIGHITFLTVLDRKKNIIGRMQHAWLVFACEKLGLLRFLLPLPKLKRNNLTLHGAGLGLHMGQGRQNAPVNEGGRPFHRAERLPDAVVDADADMDANAAVAGGGPAPGPAPTAATAATDAADVGASTGRDGGADKRRSASNSASNSTDKAVPSAAPSPGLREVDNEYLYDEFGDVMVGKPLRRPPPGWDARNLRNTVRGSYCMLL